MWNPPPAINRLGNIVACQSKKASHLGTQHRLALKVYRDSSKNVLGCSTYDRQSAVGPIDAVGVVVHFPQQDNELLPRSTI